MTEKIFGKSGTFLILLSFVFFGCAWAQPEYQAHPTVGGPCQYQSYPGQATIISIAESKDHDQSETAKVEVKFSFTPGQKIAERFARVEGMTFNLYGKNFQYPDRQFLTRNNIHVGTVLEGYLQVIVSGTCTPMLFEFPDLKQEN
jgi:hypothetical protein